MISLKVFIIYATVIVAANAETYFQRQENELVSRGEATRKEEYMVIDSDMNAGQSLTVLAALMAQQLELSPKVVAMTCVSGRTKTVDQCADNVAETLHAAERKDIKIYKGSDYPIVPPKQDGDYIFGKDGFGDLEGHENPHKLQKPEKEHAAVAIVKLVNQYPDQVVILVLGPITNIAIAILLDPKLISKLRGLVIAGGSTNGVGDSVPGTEFNAHYDPYAFLDVFQTSSFKNTIIIPFHLSLKSTLSAEFWKKFFKIDNSLIGFYEKHLQYYLKKHPKGPPTFTSLIALACYIFPEILLRITPSRVTLSGSIDTRGFMMVDEPKDVKLLNINVVYQVDYDVLKEMLLELFPY